MTIREMCKAHEALEERASDLLTEIEQRVTPILYAMGVMDPAGKWNGSLESFHINQDGIHLEYVSYSRGESYTDHYDIGSFILQDQDPLYAAAVWKKSRDDAAAITKELDRRREIEMLELKLADLRG